MHLSLVPDDHRPNDDQPRSDRPNAPDADGDADADESSSQTPRDLGLAIYNTATAAIQHALNDDHQARQLSRDVLDSQLAALDQLDDHGCRNALHGLLVGLFNDVDWPHPDHANPWTTYTPHHPREPTDQR